MKRFLILAAALAACRATPDPAPAPATPSPGAPPADPNKPYYVQDWARVPVGFKSVTFKQTHAVADCLLEFAPTAAASADGTLFVDATTPAVFHVVHGDRFHVHALHEDGRDDVLLPNKDGELEVPPAEKRPKAFVLVTHAFFLDGGGQRLFVPPYTITYRVEALEKMAAVLGAQEFAVHVADEKGAQPHSALVALPRNFNEFTFGYYNLTMDRRNVLTAAYLCAHKGVIPEPTYRASVRTKEGRVFQKVEVLPYPPGATAVAQGSDFFDFEHDGREVDRLPVPPRPVLGAPDTTKQAVPFVTVTAHLYGFSGGRYGLTVAHGFPQSEEKAAVTIESREVGSDTKAVSTTIEPDRNEKGEPIARTAFYGLRLARAWQTKSGYLRAPAVRVAGRTAEHEHTFYVATEKLPHVTMFNLAGVPPGEANFGAFGVMALNDAAVLSALGGRPLVQPSLSPNLSSSDRVNVTVINNHGLGGGTGGVPVGGANGGGVTGQGAPMYLNTGTLSLPWYGGQPQTGPVGGQIQPIGWQSRFNAPRPEGRP